jgi:hypothetical protein
VVKPPSLGEEFSRHRWALSFVETVLETLCKSVFLHCYISTFIWFFIFIHLLIFDSEGVLDSWNLTLQTLYIAST